MDEVMARKAGQDMRSSLKDLLTGPQISSKNLMNINTTFEVVSRGSHEHPAAVYPANKTAQHLGVVRKN